MCKFFSCVSNGKGKIMYFDWKLREQVLKEKLNYEPDSHTSIADYFGYKGAKEDVLNKYEYNPLTKVFEVDQINAEIDDSKEVEKFCKELDFKLIVKPLNIHPIINPFKDISTTTVDKKDLRLLKKWASVRDSVWDSVGDSVGDSVWASVWAYVSSFFDIKYKHDYSSAVKLWNRGLVPSYDGKVWRLHGKDGKVLWKGTLNGIR